MGLVTWLLFKPILSIFKPIKLIYMAGGAVVLAGILTATWVQNFELFGTMLFAAVIWSMVYSVLIS